MEVIYAMERDIVCNMEIDVKPDSESINFEGKTYFFCSKGCRAEFVRHAVEYVDASRAKGADGSQEQENV